MQIKFRGKIKNTQNTEWAYGNLVTFFGRTFIITGQTGLSFESGEANWIMFGDGWYEVIPETVGQFTGLLDKNGKEIYVGDLIQSICKDGTIIQHEIIWDAENARFATMRYPKNVWDTPSKICQSWIIEFDKEIIGNIHDKTN